MPAKAERQIFYNILRLELEPMTTPINDPVAYVIDHNACLHLCPSKHISIKSSRVYFVTDTCTSKENLNLSSLSANDKGHLKQFRSQAQRLKHQRTGKVPWQMAKAKHSLLIVF